jgi:hypothetical protein
VVDGLAQACLRRGPVAAVDELEQATQGVVEEGAVARLLGNQRGQLQVAQHLQAVALLVGVGGADGHVAQLRAGLDIEQEQQPVHQPQALQGELAGVQLAPTAEDALLLLAGLGDELAGRFVAQKLHGFLQGVLEILGNGEGVLVGVGIEGVEQYLALGRQQALPPQQYGGSLERRIVAAAEDLAPVEAQQPVLRPLGAIDEERLGGAGQQYPARRMLGAEEVVRKHLLPGLAMQGLGPGLGVPEQAVGLQREGVLALQVRVPGVQDDQPRRLAGLAEGAQRGQRPVLERQQHRLQGIAQGAEEATE